MLTYFELRLNSIIKEADLQKALFINLEKTNIKIKADPFLINYFISKIKITSLYLVYRV